MHHQASIRNTRGIRHVTLCIKSILTQNEKAFAEALVISFALASSCINTSTEIMGPTGVLMNFSPSVGGNGHVIKVLMEHFTFMYSID